MAEIKTIIDMFKDQVARSSERTALRWKQGGQWVTKSWRDYYETGRKIAAGLVSLGVQHKDRVAIIANTRREWVECDAGILFAGAATVPIYQTLTVEQTEYIISNSESKVLIVENPQQMEKAFDPAVRGKLLPLKKILYIDESVTLPAPDKKGRTTFSINDVVPEKDRGLVMSLSDLVAAGEKVLAKSPQDLDARMAACKPEDVATIVYTSGTTGNPKGVVLTHDNFVFETESVADLLQLAPSDEQLLYLPLAHIFAKILVMSQVRVGFVTAFCEGIEKIVPNMGEVKPTFFGSVPRVYEKAYSKIKSNAAAGGALKAKIFDWAIGVGRKASALRQKSKQPSGLLAFQYRLADKLVFSKIKTLFGGRVRFFISGAAPLAKEIQEFFHAADILILEGYGLTETTAATHVNRPDRYKFGTVGPAIPGVEIKTAADGEVLARGRNCLREYYKRPDDTREAIDAEGWFHTGDIGEIDKDGFLKITDRKKDLIKTSGGKYIAPQVIENLLKQSPYVSQVMVHAEGRKFVSALVTLDEENIKKWVADQGMGNHGSIAEIAHDARVKQLVQVEVDRVNAGLAQFETIKKFAILDKDFSIEGGDLTPTLKVKRKVVTEKHKKLLDSLYE